MEIHDQRLVLTSDHAFSIRADGSKNISLLGFLASGDLEAQAIVGEMSVQANRQIRPEAIDEAIGQGIELVSIGFENANGDLLGTIDLALADLMLLLDPADQAQQVAALIPLINEALVAAGEVLSWFLPTKGQSLER